MPAGSSSATRTAARFGPSSRASASGVRLGGLRPQGADTARRVDDRRLPGRFEAGRRCPASRRRSASASGPGRRDRGHGRGGCRQRERAVGPAQPGVQIRRTGPPDRCRPAGASGRPRPPPAARAAGASPARPARARPAPADRRAPAPRGRDRRAAPGPRAISAAPGVQASDHAMSSARGLGIGGPDGGDLLARRWRRGRAAAGRGSRGCVRARGISSHSGREVQPVGVAPDPPQPGQVVAVPVGPLEGAYGLLRLPER